MLYHAITRVALLFYIVKYIDQQLHGEISTHLTQQHSRRLMTSNLDRETDRQTDRV